MIVSVSIAARWRLNNRCSVERPTCRRHVTEDMNLVSNCHCGGGNLTRFYDNSKCLTFYNRGIICVCRIYSNPICTDYSVDGWCCFHFDVAISRNFDRKVLFATCNIDRPCDVESTTGGMR
jgi:hypothetical protein